MSTNEEKLMSIDRQMFEKLKKGDDNYGSEVAIFKNEEKITFVLK